MEIRIFKETDRTAVLALWDACQLTKPWNDPHNDIDRKLQFQPEFFLIGTLDNEVMASAMAGYDGHRGSVFYLAVHPTHQGNGYGQQMMAHIEILLEGLGCPKLNLAVRSTNTSVLDFYAGLAYKTDDVLSLGKRLITDD